jgi:hypothetical protein
MQVLFQKNRTETHPYTVKITQHDQADEWTQTEKATMDDMINMHKARVSHVKVMHVLKESVGD